MLISMYWCLVDFAFSDTDDRGYDAGKQEQKLMKAFLDSRLPYD